MINDNKAAYIALNFVRGVGPKLFETLLSRFTHTEAVIAASIDELCTIPRITPTIVEVDSVFGYGDNTVLNLNL